MGQGRASGLAPEKNAHYAQAMSCHTRMLRFPCPCARAPTVAPPGEDVRRVLDTRALLYPSLSFPRLPPSRPANALREVLLLELQAHRIVFRIREVGQPVNHPDHEKNPGIVSYRHARIAPFYANERRLAHRGSLRDNRHGDTPPTPRILDVTAKLAQSATYWYRQTDHFPSLLFKVNFKTPYVI